VFDWRKPGDERRKQALSYLYEGDWDSAAKIFEELLASRRTQGGNIANAAHDLATTYNHLGRNEEAIRLFLEALAHEESVPDHPLLSWTLHGLAAAHLGIGEFAIAARRARRALALAEAELSARRGHTPSTVGAIARVLAKACEGAGDRENADVARRRFDELCPSDTPRRVAIREALERLSGAFVPGSTPYRGRSPDQENEAAPASLTTSVAHRLRIVARLRERVANDHARLALPLTFAAEALAFAGDTEQADLLLRDALRACADARLSLEELRDAVPRLARTCTLLGHGEAAQVLARIVSR